MGRLVNETYPHIFWTPCAAHCLDLLVEDIAKLPWVKEIVGVARFLVRFITKRPKVLSMFRSFSTLEIVKIAPTRLFPNSSSFKNDLYIVHTTL